MESVQVGRQTVVNRPLPVNRWQRLALGVRDRDHRLPGKLAVDSRQFRQVEPTVQRRHMWTAVSPRQREMQVIDVEVNHVEIFGPAVNLVEHDEVMGELIYARRVCPQRPWTRSDKSRLGDRIPASEKRNVVPLPDQFFRQIGGDAFCASIVLWWNAFIQWGDLCNPHHSSLVRHPGAAILQGVGCRVQVPRVHEPTSTKVQKPYRGSSKYSYCRLRTVRIDFQHMLRGLHQEPQAVYAILRP